MNRTYLRNLRTGHCRETIMVKIVPKPISKACLDLISQAEADRQKIQEQANVGPLLGNRKEGSYYQEKLLSRNAQASILGLLEGL